MTCGIFRRHLSGSVSISLPNLCFCRHLFSPSHSLGYFFSVNRKISWIINLFVHMLVISSMKSIRFFVVVLLGKYLRGWKQIKFRRKTWLASRSLLWVPFRFATQHMIMNWELIRIIPTWKWFALFFWFEMSFYFLRWAFIIRCKLLLS